MKVIKLNVYGDNILECERALSYLETGIRRQENEILKKELVDGFIITPRYNIIKVRKMNTLLLCIQG